MIRILVPLTDVLDACPIPRSKIPLNTSLSGCSFYSVKYCFVPVRGIVEFVTHICLGTEEAYRHLNQWWPHITAEYTRKGYDYIPSTIVLHGVASRDLTFPWPFSVLNWPAMDLLCTKFYQLVYSTGVFRLRNWLFSAVSLPTLLRYICPHLKI